MGVNERRQDAQGHANAAWDRVMRGTWEVEDTKEHRRIEVSSNEMKAQITAHNIAEGYARYRVVSQGQLGQ